MVAVGRRRREYRLAVYSPVCAAVAAAAVRAYL
jgi:hypothetical protein